MQTKNGPGISARSWSPITWSPVVFVENEVIQVFPWVITLSHPRAPFKTFPGQYMLPRQKNVPYFLDRENKIG